MFRKIVDVLKEVFWIKPSRKKRKSAQSQSLFPLQKIVTGCPRKLLSRLLNLSLSLSK